MDLAWYFGMGVEAGLEDLEGALAEGDLPTAFLSAVFTLNSTALAWECIAGRPLTMLEPEVYATLGHARADALAAYARWPLVSELTDAAMREIEADVRAAVERLRAAMPFELPGIREHDGLMPSLRAARQIDHLRRRYGIGPFPWPGLIS
jgi:hypothetical protein